MSHLWTFLQEMSAQSDQRLATNSAGTMSPGIDENDREVLGSQPRHSSKFCRDLFPVVTLEMHAHDKYVDSNKLIIYTRQN